MKQSKKPLKGHEAIREKIDSDNTLSVKTFVEASPKPKTKVSIGL